MSLPLHLCYILHSRRPRSGFSSGGPAALSCNVSFNVQLQHEAIPSHQLHRTTVRLSVIYDQSVTSINDEIMNLVLSLPISTLGRLTGNKYMSCDKLQVEVTHVIAKVRPSEIEYLKISVHNPSFTLHPIFKLK